MRAFKFFDENEYILYLIVLSDFFTSAPSPPLEPRIITFFLFNYIINSIGVFFVIFAASGSP
jgi:hypothetical protein